MRPRPLLVTAVFLAAVCALAGGGNPPTAPAATPVNANAAADANKPSLRVAPDGTAYVAWVEQRAGHYRARVAAWTGSERNPLAGGLNQQTDSDAYDVALALDADGKPTVAWSERSSLNAGKASGPGKLHIARWNGRAWQELGPSPSRSAIAAPDVPRLAVGPRGETYVQWSEIPPDFNADNVFAARWNGGTWEAFDLGSLSSDISSSSRSRDLAVDADGKPVLAWSAQQYLPGTGAAGFDVFAGPWDGKAWKPLGKFSLNLRPDQYAGAVSLRLDRHDRPVVAFHESWRGFDVRVKRWDGRGWRSLGERVNERQGDGSDPKLALDANGTPYVAWIDTAGGSRLRVSRWDGRAWRALGGVLNLTASASADSATIDLTRDGRPVVAWRESAATRHRIWMKRWNGTAWAALGD